jgi:hypothetical protein
MEPFLADLGDDIVPTTRVAAARGVGRSRRDYRIVDLLGR